MLSTYQELYYANPQDAFERSINFNLDGLCVAAQGGGLQAIQAQTRLKLLKQASLEERLKIYQIAIGSISA